MERIVNGLTIRGNAAIIPNILKTMAFAMRTGTYNEETGWSQVAPDTLSELSGEGYEKYFSVYVKLAQNYSAIWYFLRVAVWDPQAPVGTEVDNYDFFIGNSFGAYPMDETVCVPIKDKNEYYNNLINWKESLSHFNHTIEKDGDDAQYAFQILVPVIKYLNDKMSDEQMQASDYGFLISDIRDIPDILFRGLRFPTYILDGHHSLRVWLDNKEIILDTMDNGARNDLTYMAGISFKDPHRKTIIGSLMLSKRKNSLSSLRRPGNSFQRKNFWRLELNDVEMSSNVIEWEVDSLNPISLQMSGELARYVYELYCAAKNFQVYWKVGSIKYAPTCDRSEYDRMSRYPDLPSRETVYTDQLEWIDSSERTFRWKDVTSVSHDMKMHGNFPFALIEDLINEQEIGFQKFFCILDDIREDYSNDQCMMVTRTDEMTFVISRPEHDWKSNVSIQMRFKKNSNKVTISHHTDGQDKADWEIICDKRFGIDSFDKYKFEDIDWVYMMCQHIRIGFVNRATHDEYLSPGDDPHLYFGNSVDKLIQHFWKSHGGDHGLSYVGRMAYDGITHSFELEQDTHMLIYRLTIENEVIDFGYTRLTSPFRAKWVPFIGDTILYENEEIRPWMSRAFYNFLHMCRQEYVEYNSQYHFKISYQDAISFVDGNMGVRYPYWKKYSVNGYLVKVGNPPYIMIECNGHRLCGSVDHTEETPKKDYVILNDSSFNVSTMEYWRINPGETIEGNNFIIYILMKFIEEYNKGDFTPVETGLFPGYSEDARNHFDNESFTVQELSDILHMMTKEFKEEREAGKHMYRCKLDSGNTSYISIIDGDMYFHLYSWMDVKKSMYPVIKVHFQDDGKCVLTLNCCDNKFYPTILDPACDVYHHTIFSKNGIGSIRVDLFGECMALKKGNIELM